jgi:flagellar motor component MotA
MQSLEATHRAVKRSQEAFDDITQRFERRVNEITEMQRLTEERFRQEWVTFKADDQKRWTNYTLTQEEQQRENTRQFEKMIERLVTLEDSTQEVRDMLQEVVQETHARLQVLRAAFNETAEEFERSFGHNR